MAGRGGGKEEDLKKASALWIAQIGHMTKKIPSSDLPSKLNCRHVYMDNFYTRHKLAMGIFKFSDNDIMQLALKKSFDYGLPPMHRVIICGLYFLQ